MSNIALEMSQHFSSENHFPAKNRFSALQPKRRFSARFSRWDSSQVGFHFHLQLQSWHWARRLSKVFQYQSYGKAFTMEASSNVSNGFYISSGPIARIRTIYTFRLCCHRYIPYQMRLIFIWRHPHSTEEALPHFIEIQSPGQLIVFEAHYFGHCLCVLLIRLTVPCCSRFVGSNRLAISRFVGFIRKCTKIIWKQSTFTDI